MNAYNFFPHGDSRHYWYFISVSIKHHFRIIFFFQVFIAIEFLQENGKLELAGELKAKYTKILEERNMSPEATLEWVVHNFIR